MPEITILDARELQREDVLCLMNWRDHTDESLVECISIQGLLDLYHASSAYVSLEGWLNEQKGAWSTYRKVVSNHRLLQSA